MVAPLLAFSQLDRSIVPSAGKAPIINIKDSETFKTKNGITVILSENHKIPRVTFDLVMGATPQMEGKKAGVAEITAALIAAGTSTYTKDQLDSKIDYIGASLSADKNSLTLSCLTKHMKTGLDLMTDVLYNANFPESEFERIVKQTESALISTKSDASTMGRNTLAKSNFMNHPYGEVMNEESLKAITLEDVRNYYKSNFTPDGSYLVIVGDISRKEAEAAVDNYFANWTGEKVIKINYERPAKNQGNRVLFVNKPGAVQSYILVSFPMKIESGSDDELALSVLNGVLGGGSFNNRLIQNLREDKAYTYGCSSGTSIRKEGALFYAGGNFRNAVTDSALTEILKEIDGICNGYVTDEELKSTKASMAGDFGRSLESPNTIARFALNIIRNNLSKDYYQTYLKKLDAVTKEDLLIVAQKYLTPKNCNIIVVGNEEVLDKISKFDADGTIEKLDAFGNEVKEIEKAAITADELIEKYISATTLTTSEKALKKKISKVKAVTKNVTLTMSQAPFPIQSKEVWTAPNGEGTKIEANGMIFQKSYFNGKIGYSSNMQTGKVDMTAEEIAARGKSIGLFPEMNYKTSGMKYEIVGLEKNEAGDMYILKTNDGKTETFDYFDAKTFMKVKTVKTMEVEGEVQESTTVYSNYKEVGGFLFAHKMTSSMAGVVFDGEMKEVLINQGSLEDFK